MKKSRLNYAVVGLGHIAQVAVLPAFKASKNSELAALVSGDPTKLKTLSKRYKVESTYSYEEYDQCLQDESIDAIYIALPNALHKDYVLKAAEAGKHILCEKPLAVTVADAKQMIRAAQHNKVKLMTAYRLHFDPTNLKAIELVHSGKIGEPRYFTSEFGHQVKAGNIRALPEEGGTPLHDLGIYCINAARYIMRDEPIEVFAMAASPAPRLPKIEQTVSAILKFPQDRMASFLCSFASAGVSNFRVIGDKGDLCIENVYEYVGESTNTLTVNEKARTWTSKAGDQFAAELDYFSSCVFQNKQPETSGEEGLADLRVIEALMQSIESGKSVKLGKTAMIKRRPTMKQMIRKPAHRKPALVHAAPESRS
jgi:predicted dehydrogenase